MLSDPTNALLGKPLVCTVIIEDRPVSLKVSAEKGAICAGGISSTAHFTLITATLTDYDKSLSRAKRSVSPTRRVRSILVHPVRRPTLRTIRARFTRFSLPTTREVTEA